MPPEPVSASDSQVEQWLNAAREGSSDALGNLLETFRQYLALLAEHGVGADLKAKVGPSDVLQDTFLEAQRDFSQFRGQSRVQLQAWLRRLLLNNLLNARRKFRLTQKRALKSEVSLGVDTGGQPLQLAADDTSPSNCAIRNEDAMRLQEGLKRLPTHYREVIVLRNYQHLSFAEIGQQMQRSEDGARMLWARAFEQLAVELERSSEER